MELQELKQRIDRWKQRVSAEAAFERLDSDVPVSPVPEDQSFAVVEEVSAAEELDIPLDDHVEVGDDAIEESLIAEA